MEPPENFRDTPESVAARREQDDPWVQHIVVLREPARPLVEVLAAAARAVCDCVDRYEGDPRFADDFRAWNERSFRKVTLRAKPAEWARLSMFPAGEGRSRGEALVRALPPVLRSRRDPFLAKLQAWTADPSELPPPRGPEEGAPTMRFVLNAAVTMRGGKLAAQVSHAVLIARERFDRTHAEGFAAWDAAGRPCRFFAADRATWAAVRAREPAAVVRDAGITEVEPGTETVMALPPAIDARGETVGVALDAAAVR